MDIGKQKNIQENFLDEIQVTGVLAEVIFHNEDNGYTVAEFETEDELFTVVGVMASVTEGSTYILNGKFTEHQVYGLQFSISSYTEKMPESTKEIEAFLASGILKGIGPVTAALIVKRFGKETLKILDETPGRLKEIPGIGQKKAAAIGEAYKEHSEYAKTAMFLQKFGVKPKAAMKIYKIFGSKTEEKISKNPYLLVGEVYGIGFKRADAIAANMGIKQEDENRIACGIVHILNEAVRSGHVFLPRKDLCEKAAELLEVSIEACDDVIIQLAFSGKIAVEKMEEREIVYLFEYYKAEKIVTGKLVMLGRGKVKPLTLDPDNMIRQTEAEKGISFSEEQKIAMKNCINNGVSVITGGPGTGKTTLINGIINILMATGLKVSICAPTGRAAKRITETSGFEASTIHRLLEYHINPDSGFMEFGKREDKPLKTDVVIVDEASMLDLMLAQALLDAMTEGMRLILVGDVDQLPSVGAGNVLKDIIDSEFVYCERLTKIFRQAGESMIVVNAHRINQGESPFCNEKDKDFFFMTRHREGEVLSLILDLASKRLPNYFNFEDKVQDIQILSPRRKGILGTENLNRELQEILNPKSNALVEKKVGDRIFRENDKVMQIKNNYDIQWICATTMEKGEGVFNGDVGFIKKINLDDNIITIVFDGDKYADYDFGQLEQLDLAYAVTVHKSQGAEFPAVIMPVSWLPPALAGRNLLYTAVTRGKKAVVLVGEKRYMDAMIENDSVKDRNSGLAVRMKQFL